MWLPCTYIWKKLLKHLKSYKLQVRHRVEWNRCWSKNHFLRLTLISYSYACEISSKEIANQIYQSPTENRVNIVPSLRISDQSSLFRFLLRLPGSSWSEGWSRTEGFERTTWSGRTARTTWFGWWRWGRWESWERWEKWERWERWEKWKKWRKGEQTNFDDV